MLRSCLIKTLRERRSGPRFFACQQSSSPGEKRNERSSRCGRPGSDLLPDISFTRTFPGAPAIPRGGKARWPSFTIQLPIIGTRPPFKHPPTPSPIHLGAYGGRSSSGEATRCPAHSGVGGILHFPPPIQRNMWIHSQLHAHWGLSERAVLGDSQRWRQEEVWKEGKRRV